MVRPSRTYKGGVGKPVVARRYDEVIRSYQWAVVWPPCNNFGNYVVAPEADMVHRAWLWCMGMNSRDMKARQ